MGRWRRERIPLCCRGAGEEGRKEGASEGVVVDAEVWCGGGLPVPGGGGARDVVQCRCCSARLWLGLDQARARRLSGVGRPPLRAALVIPSGGSARPTVPRQAGGRSLSAAALRAWPAGGRLAAGAWGVALRHAHGTGSVPVCVCSRFLDELAFVIASSSGSFGNLVFLFSGDGDGCKQTSSVSLGKQKHSSSPNRK